MIQSICWNSLLLRCLFSRIKMSCNADINSIAWQRRFNEAVIFKKEVHQNPDCRFEKGTPFQILMGRITVYLLFRTCWCGRRITKRHLMGKGYIPHELIEDGVEAHLSETCYYDKKFLPDGQTELQKVCYCPRELHLP